MVIDKDKSIEDWMENGNIRYNSCRWFTTYNINGNCPLLTEKCANRIVKTLTKQPTEEYNS